MSAGITTSGSYWINPSNPVQVNCDMATDGGGWTQYATLAIPVTTPGGGVLAGTIKQVTQAPFHTRVMVMMTLVSAADAAASSYAWASWDVGSNSPTRWLLNTTPMGIQEAEPNGHYGTNTATATVGTVSLQDWNQCYSANATTGVYQWGNTGFNGGPNCYGTFSLFTGSTATVAAGPPATPPLLFALDRWAAGATLEMGIGNNPATPYANGGPNPDWTFAQNAGSYSTRNLAWYVR
jgi:hypothetical protein